MVFTQHFASLSLFWGEGEGLTYLFCGHVIGVHSILERVFPVSIKSNSVPGSRQRLCV